MREGKLFREIIIVDFEKYSLQMHFIYPLCMDINLLQLIQLLAEDVQT